MQATKNCLNNFLPAKLKYKNFNYSREQTLIKKFATRADFFHKVNPDCGKKIIYPQLGAYFTALSGERNKFPTGAPLIVCIYRGIIACFAAN